MRHVVKWPLSKAQRRDQHKCIGLAPDSTSIPKAEFSRTVACILIMTSINQSNILYNMLSILRVNRLLRRSARGVFFPTHSQWCVILRGYCVGYEAEVTLIRASQGLMLSSLKKLVLHNPAASSQYLIAIGSRKLTLCHQPVTIRHVQSTKYYVGLRSTYQRYPRVQIFSSGRPHWRTLSLRALH